MWKIKEKISWNNRIICIIPYFLFSSFFIIVPLIFLFVNAFSFNKDFNNWEVALSSNTINIIWRSIFTGMSSSFICLIIGIPFSYIVAMSKNKMFKILSISLMLSPLFIFTIVKTLALKSFLLYFLDSDGKGVALNNNGIIILGLTYLYLPFFIIPVYSIFNNMPRSLIESSNDIGYNLFKTMFKVVLPYSLKSILSGFSLVFILSSTNIVIFNKLLTNSQQHQSIGTLIIDHSHPSNPLEVATASSIALITIFIISFLYFLIYFFPIIIRKIKGGINV